MAITRTKVTIVGSGTVGSTLAFNLVCENICDDIMLIDINRGKAAANVGDLRCLPSFNNRKMNITYGDYSMCGDSDVVVLAVSAPHGQGTTKFDVLGSAGTTISTIIPEIMLSGFNGFFVVITNPVDTITYLVKKISGLPSHKVIGTGTMLDTMRLRSVISDHFNFDQRAIEAYCIGEHGEFQFTPWSLVRVGTKLIHRVLDSSLDPEAEFAEIERKMADQVEEIVRVKGATIFGIVSVTTQILKAIFHDENKILCVSVMLNGEYETSGVYAGVPAVVGRNGVNEILTLDLSEREKAKMRLAIDVIKETTSKVSHLIT